MKVSRADHGGIPILELEGEFDSFETELVRDGFDKIVSEGKKHVVMDLGEMTFANSTTIAFLITAQKRVGAMGGRLVLARPRDFIRRTLRTLGLDQVFPVAGSVEEAVATLKPR
jgi:anti-sigma B factor antagonist